MSPLFKNLSSILNSKIFILPAGISLAGGDSMGYDKKKKKDWDEDEDWEDEDEDEDEDEE